MAATAEALLLNDSDTIDAVAPSGGWSSGQVIQLKDGRAAVVCGLKDVAAGDSCTLAVRGRHTILKTTGIVFLNGGKTFWDHSANKAHFKAVNDRDFYVGAVVGDTTSAATTMVVDLNVEPRYLVDLARDAYITVPVGTVAAGGFGVPYREGGSLKFNITATSEAQKADALSVAGFALGANAIIEGAFRIGAAGSGSASDYSFGIANASHASNADTITDSLFIHLDGASTNINVECDDGTNETAATDTTLDFTAGTALANRVEFWMDLRDPASVKVYVEGVRVLDGTTGASTTLNISASVATWFLLAHLEKSTGTETAEATLDWLRSRISED